MGVERVVLIKGNGTVKPMKGDTVKLEYTGSLYEESNSAKYHQGKQYVVRSVSINQYMVY